MGDQRLFMVIICSKTMHLQSRKKKSWVEKGWAEDQDHSGLSSWIPIIPLHWQNGEEEKNTYKKKLPLKCSRTQGCSSRPALKALSGWRQEMHQLRPVITLCGLTEACVLIMSGQALFLRRFFNTACLLCVCMDMMSAALSSAVPK